MFKRKIYDQLQAWKGTSNGKTAVLIEGARRVGKSTIVEAFARANYDDYLLLDFTTESEDVKRVFTENIADLDELYRNLFLLKGKTLPKGRAVIIFDEVQLFPIARQSIKALVADGRYHFIETGSLISIKKNTQDILIPSEEHKLKMYPMDFEEFCWARGDDVSCDAIREAFEAKKPLGASVHRRLMKEFRTYMAVGGMPQAVQALVDGGTFEEIDFTKRAILELYEDDLHKYDEGSAGHVGAVFKTIPEQLSTHGKCFSYALVDKGMRYDRLISSFNFLAESMMVNLCENVTTPDALLDLHVQHDRFKMFMGDTGLFVTQVMSGDRGAGESLYKALISDNLDSNLGMVMENAVAQALVARGHSLRFHEFEYKPSDAVRPKKYEIDFLLVRGKRVCPIEVKSSGYRAHKSLDCFSSKYDIKINERYVLCTKDVTRDDSVVYLPLYMAMCL